MKVGDRIRERRKVLGLTQKELAMKVNVSSQVVSNWERGYTDPDHDDIAHLAEALEISADYLLGRTDNQTPFSPSTPSWWYRNTPPTDVELEEFLQKANVYFDGAPLNEEDKEDILTYLKVKWEREKKKREKNRS